MPDCSPELQQKHDHILAEHEVRLDHIEEEVKEIKDLRSGINDLRLITESLSRDIQNLLDTVKISQKSIDENHSRIKELEQKPAQAWNTMQKTIFTTIVSVIAGSLATAVLMSILQNIH